MDLALARGAALGLLGPNGAGKTTLLRIGRYWTAIAEGPVTGGLHPWRLRLIDERLREVREAPTLAELAALCRLSVRHLTRGFRASRGCSIGD